MKIVFIHEDYFYKKTKLKIVSLTKSLPKPPLKIFSSTNYNKKK